MSAPTHELPSHAQRVVAEHRDLKYRCTQLSAFITGMAFTGLPVKHQDLLREQLVVMCKYRVILEQRIQLFNQEAIA